MGCARRNSRGSSDQLSRTHQCNGAFPGACHAVTTMAQPYAQAGFASGMSLLSQYQSGHGQDIHPLPRVRGGLPYPQWVACHVCWFSASALSPRNFTGNSEISPN